MPSICQRASDNGVITTQRPKKQRQTAIRRIQKIEKERELRTQNSEGRSWEKRNLYGNLINSRGSISNKKRNDGLLQKNGVRATGSLFREEDG